MCFAKIANGWKELTIFGKISILNVSLRSEYICDYPEAFSVIVNWFFHFESFRNCCNLFSTLLVLTLFRMGFFGTAHGWGCQKGLRSLKSVTHILQWWNLTKLYLTQRRSKNIWIAWHTPSVLLTSASFHQKPANLAIWRNTDIDCILIHNFYLF